MNREVIAVDQDSLGMQGRKVRDSSARQVWVKPLADGSRAVILFNRGSEESPIAVPWEDIGLFPAARPWSAISGRGLTSAASLAALRQRSSHTAW